MKKNLSFIGLASTFFVLTALAIVALLDGGSIGSLMIHEKKSPYSYEKTISTIQENARAHDWLIPKKYNFQKSLRKQNQPDCGKVTVLKLCHPEIAGRMLAKDRNKFVSVMMPCSVSVYEKQDGNTYVAAMNMSLMSKVMGSESREILQRIEKEDAVILGFLE